MIAILRSGLRSFLRDPMGALEEMRDIAPAASVAVMALVAAGLIHVVLDHLAGAWAFPHSFEPGGKRAGGPVVGTLVVLSRLFGTAAGLWLVARVLGQPVRWALAMWMVVPFALAEIGLDLLELSTAAIHELTTLNLYGGLFLIGFTGTLLVLIASVKAALPGRDWLGALGASVVIWGGGTYIPFLVLPIAGILHLTERAK
ncbi:hypothetical protein ACK8OR_02115 [Jannaschia sp. KMU-145]|uniref:hypothetical protein n=1 Tax=Jannaschia halovivens TaxID=3388667 RepID=UPI00396AFB03